MNQDMRPRFAGSASVPPARTSGISFFRPLAALLVVLIALGSPLATMARQSPGEPYDRAAIQVASTALVSLQGPDGAYAGFSGEPDVTATLDALTALAAARSAGVEVDLGPTLAYLAAGALVYAQTGPASAARLAIALAAAGEDPSEFASVNAVALVAAGFDEGAGFCGAQVYEHSLCVMALVVGGADVPAAWIDVLRANQNDDGGWVFDGAAGSRASDSNTTAVALQAMIAAGVPVDDAVVIAGRDYLRSLVAVGGGFAYMLADPLVADANSTALGIQALLALGEDPRSADWGDPVAALLAMQNASGLFAYSAEYPDDNLFATVQAVPALAGLAMPLIAVR